MCKFQAIVNGNFNLTNTLIHYEFYWHDLFIYPYVISLRLGHHSHFCTWSKWQHFVMFSFVSWKGPYNNFIATLSCFISCRKNWYYAMIYNELLPSNSKNKPRGLYFSKALFEGLIFGGAPVRREICVSKSIGLALFLEGNLPFFCFTLYLRAICKYKPPGRLIFGGEF